MFFQDLPLISFVWRQTTAISLLKDKPIGGGPCRLGHSERRHRIFGSSKGLKLSRWTTTHTASGLLQSVRALAMSHSLITARDEKSEMHLENKLKSDVRPTSHVLLRDPAPCDKSHFTSHHPAPKMRDLLVFKSRSPKKVGSSLPPVKEFLFTLRGPSSLHNNWWLAGHTYCLIFQTLVKSVWSHSYQGRTQSSEDRQCFT